MANEPSKTPTPQMIPLSKIHEVPGVFNAKPQDKALGGLVSSIQSGGVKEPVILRDRGDGEYQLLNGYRRRRASELAKLQEVPALVYEMTLQEAIAYRKAVKDKPDTPIPGKLVDPNADKGKGAEKPTEAVKADAAGKDGKEKQGDAPTTPAAEGKDAEKPAEAVKTDAADKDGKEKQGDAPTTPAAEGKSAEKPAEAVKADTADKDGKEKQGNAPITPAAEGKDAEKPTEAVKTDTPSKDEAEHKPSMAELEAQAKAGKPVSITAMIEAQQREREAEKNVAAAERGNPKGTLRLTSAEAQRLVKEAAQKAPAVAKAADGPALERAAEGPAGTAITQIFDKRLDPPTEHTLKDLPVPKEGESFFITLHPAYLEKSEYNTFSVDTQSENFKELLKSVELVGIKDPVLARFGKEGKLEILSGQRRHLAATMLNQAVPTIIQKIDDADAKIMVADGNLHRDKISSYDLSRALRMKMEGMKQKAGRRKKGFTADELRSDDKLALEMGITVSKLNRMIRLSEATKGVCDLVDEGKLTLSVASSISFLKPENQDMLLHLMDLGYKPTTERIERMKKAGTKKKLTDTEMRDILDDKDIAPKITTPPAANAGSAPTQPEQSAQNAPAPQTIPASPDMMAKAPTDSSAPGMSSPTQEAGAPTEQAPTPAAQQPNAPTPTAEKEDDPFKGAQERPEVTKVILTGDRLRKYFPDVSMTPREIEESIYGALEERRQRQERQKQKEAIFKKSGPTR